LSLAVGSLSGGAGSGGGAIGASLAAAGLPSGRPISAEPGGSAGAVAGAAAGAAAVREAEQGEKCQGGDLQQFHGVRPQPPTLLANYVADPAAQRLILSLTGYITDRPETLTVTDMIPIYGYYFHGGVYPKGGSGRLAEVLANVVRDRGGSIRLKSPVRRIQVVNGKAAGIELATGERLDAAAVISNADYKRTFLELIDAAHLAADFRSEVERTEPACSAFRVHLAIDFVPDIKPAQNMKSVDGMDLEVVLPSLIDPTAAPTGYATVEMTTLIPHAEALSWFPTTAGDGINSWERSAAYRARKTALGDRLIALAEAAIPDLRRHIVFRSDATPVTMAHFDWSADGAI
jgi:all-trans-retinol 13,14-reductase